MMKRFRLWIKELSLTQQLVSIIFVIVLSLAVFFFVFLANSVDKLVSNEMYKSIHRAQMNVKFYIESNFEDFQKIADSNIIHIIFDLDGKEAFLINASTIDEALFLQIEKDISVANNHSQDYVFADNEVLYSTLLIDNENIAIASIMNNTYKLEFRNAIVNSFVNANLSVICISFAILMLWVSGLIHALSQITNYINQIKNDDTATLEMNRHDEIGEVANALIEMKDQLDKENRIKEEMIQNVSHDLKTPIATIKSYSESIKDGIYPYDTLEKSVDVIIEHADRLEKKVYQLILLNKMGYLQDKEDDSFDLNMKTTIEKVIVSLKVVKPSIELKAQLDEVYFHGDEEPWRIVVENLLDNALRYAKTYVEIKLTDDELTVTNDGSHLDEERLAKLFKPYEKGTDGKFGLGLSIVQRVTSTYGYSVNAENLTDGVCFRIRNKRIKSFKIQDETIDDAQIVQKPAKKKKTHNES